MVLAKKYNLMSEQAYLDGELLSDIRHEYIEGEVYAMVGAHKYHNQIVMTVSNVFYNHLLGKPCQPYASDMKVKIDRKYFYPDVMVDCSQVDADYYIEQPSIIVEVLSKSTRQHDKTVKRLAYFQIASLKEYVLIEQDFVEIEFWSRDENNYWQQSVYYLGDDITFHSIDLTVSVEDIYRQVKNEDMLEWWEKKAQQQLDLHN
ncbi:MULTISPECIES: Uma2 family endonuclease [Acinetobacter]|uniref:Uma2 family endonuclease n=1 Tax=Acinetobacter TaxID=469 RepID=UPI0005B33CEF|nr:MULTISPECIES: Uma2 family endonuclease [Acinetobacter]AWA48671.1 Uma2 family endonuclease [Acinetobacter junii]MDH1005949.1 Uma2 family endonuclease [Acinetobacter junii]MDI6621433.1 Uma2 family endonuclease [Acinetobacter junii]QXR27083.1 Uma2 family endonuclease [Acinetobacter junii]